MVQTRNSILIQAPARLIYELAADVVRWPAILQHYRFVNILGGARAGSEDWRRVRMGASRSHIPVSWVAVQRLFPHQQRIEYHHIAGPTKGMNVVWQVAGAADAVEVTIEHALESSPHWWMRIPPVAHFVGTLFVMNIADKTLQGIKLEAERLANEFVLK